MAVQDEIINLVYRCDTSGADAAAKGSKELKGYIDSLARSMSGVSEEIDGYAVSCAQAASAAKQHAQAVGGYTTQAVQATSAAKQHAAQVASATSATQANASASQSQASATQASAQATRASTSATQANTSAQQANASASSNSTAQVNSHAQASSRSASAQAKTSGATRDASDGMARFNQRLMVGAQLLDDMQYVGEQGLRPIIGNLVQLNPILGITAIGIDVVRKHTEELKTAGKNLNEYWHFDKLTESAGGFGEKIKEVTGFIVDMGQTGVRWIADLGDGFDAFMGGPKKRDKDAIKGFIQAPTEEDQERAKGIKQAVGSMPHELILGQLMAGRAKLSPDFGKPGQARDHEAARISGVIDRATKGDRNAMHELGILSTGTEFGKEVEKFSRGKDAQKIAKELMPSLGTAIGEGRDDAELMGIIKHKTPLAFPHERLARGAHEDALKIAKEQFDKDVGEHRKNGVTPERAKVEVREMYRAQRDKIKNHDEAKAAADKKELDEAREKEEKEFKDLQAKRMPGVALSQEARGNIAKADRPGMDPKRRSLLERLQAKDKAGTATTGDLMAISKLEEEQDKTDGRKAAAGGKADMLIQRQTYSQLVQQGVEPGEAERLANAAPAYYREKNRNALNQLKAAKAVNPVDQVDNRPRGEKIMDPDGLNRVPDQGMFRDQRTLAERAWGDAPRFARPVPNSGFHSMPIGPSPAAEAMTKATQVSDKLSGGTGSLEGVLARNIETIEKNTETLNRMLTQGIRTRAVIGRGN